MKKWPRQYSLVTVVDNETGERTTGHILEYTPEQITIRKLETVDSFGKINKVELITLDAKKVHFE